jgi:hypothetical protein
MLRPRPNSVPVCCVRQQEGHQQHRKDTNFTTSLDGREDVALL